MKPCFKSLSWKKAWPAIEWRACYKTTAEDFQVIEELSFPLNAGEGEHLYVFVEKINLTSHQLMLLLADYFKLKVAHVGYAGLKDKKAITRQWLSIYLPGRAQQIDLEMLIGSQLVTARNSNVYTGQCRILKACWHRAKLRRGAVSNNHFKIVCRSEQQIPTAVEQRLQLISSKGFPNYFGAQRFGFNGNNIIAVTNWFNGNESPDQFRQGILISSARSFLFNHILQSRVQLNNWNQAVAGDCFMLQGSRKYFQQKLITTEVINRTGIGDIHPMGVLWGIGTTEIKNQACIIQQQAISEFKDWQNVLQHKKVEASLRPLRCIPQKLKWRNLDRRTLLLEFALPSGSYATALLSELGVLTEKNNE